MDPRRRTARIAGLWYLAMAVSGPIGILYVPSRIVVPGDAAATAANIVAHGALLRVGIAAALVCQITFVLLVLALGRLFQGVSAAHTRLMVALVVAAVPVAVVNELCLVAALELCSGASYLGALPPGTRDALALSLLHVHEQGIFIAGVFWGLWLLPFGVLAIRSGFIPKILGVLLVVGCFSYLIDSGVALLAPPLHAAVTSVLMLPLAAGEVAMVLWLVIVGARSRDVPAPAV